ncbi:hypothetical protein D3C75_1225550 [compost metagenome]
MLIYRQLAFGQQLLGFLLQGGYRPLYCRQQQPLLNGLHQIVHRPQSQGVLGIGKFLIGADKNHLGLKPAAPDFLQHINA